MISESKSSMEIDLKDIDDELMVGHMEEEAKRRRLKIQELRSKRKLPGDADEPMIETTKSDLPKPKFRSYIPADEKLKTSTLEPVQPSDVKTQITDMLEHNDGHAIFDDIDLTKLAPRKIDWDLKKNIARKLEKLDRRTHIAIASIIRERIMSQKGDVQDFDQAVQDLAVLETGETYE